MAGFGIQTAGVAAGGYTTGATELYNGSTWTTNPNSMATGRGNVAGAGTQSLGLAFGGTPPLATATEEFTGPGSPVTKTITTS